MHPSTPFPPLPQPPERQRWRIALSTDQLAVVAGLYFACTSNGAFFAAVMAGRPWSAASSWGYAVALLLMLSALHVLLVALVAHRRVVTPLLAGLVVSSTVASYFMEKYGTYLDPTMLRNVIATDWPEARELLGTGLVVHAVLGAGLPLLLLSRVDVVERPWARAIVTRIALVAASAAALAACLLAVFQDFGPAMRNQHELRYLITPANYLYSAARVLAAASAETAAQRTPVGTDARLGAKEARRGKPLLFVVVVGETARATNWGLNGYARQTTPQLAALGVHNFKDVTACGTNTETSLPCMFAAVGRRDYDEKRIRGSESLLHVAARAGYDVRWIDNQSGCKGVCDGLPFQRPQRDTAPGLCDDDRCLDEALLQGLEEATRDVQGNRLVVLHMLGNHGPAYYRRYPPSFRRLTPTCDTPELRKCSREQIVNSYDNALMYTDHVLARAVRLLQSQAARYDTGLLYLSDHGESLGEKGLYLHGLPYMIAPAEQTRVPMVWWLSAGMAASAGLDQGCIQRQAARPWTHDALFHSALGLLGVQTAVYEPALDISAPCRS